MAVDVLGIDVGGTSIKAVRTNADGAVLASESIATPGDAAALTAAVGSLAGALRSTETIAVGVVCPGVVDDGVARFAANLPWRDEPVRATLTDALHLPVFVAHDVAAAALAESAQVDADDVVFVSLGTGIARAQVVGGVVRGGATGRAGELGHCPVRPDGELCACGQRGCLEAYSSAAAIARRYEARTGRPSTAREVAATVGTDPDATTVWGEAVAALALALTTETLLVDPAVIVLGGGLADAGETLFAPLRTALAARLVWRAPPPLLPATLGASAGRIGAAQLAWRGVVAQNQALQQEGSLR